VEVVELVAVHKDHARSRTISFARTEAAAFIGSIVRAQSSRETGGDDVEDEWEEQGIPSQSGHRS